MIKLVKIYYNINRAVGLFNLHYDQKKGEFISHHKPTILYCALVDTAILSLLPFITIAFIKSTYYCESIKSIVISTSLLIITDHATIIVIMLTTWWQRQAICRWCNAFARMLEAYLGVSDTYEYHDIVQGTQISHDIQLMQRMQDIRYEMRESSKTFNPRVWLKQLQGDVDAITTEAAKLKKMIYELVRILQMPYLCLLLNAFQSLIAIMFHILRFTQQRHLDIITVIFYLIVLSANITNLMKSFQVCEYLCEDFKIINELVYALILNDNLRQAVNENDADNSLVLSLEIFLLYLKQPFQVTLCGMFELNNNTGLSMLKSVGLNLLYLIQIVLSKNEI
uniref:Gustatory receptor n=1 Tax=Glossina austeni TaxID=7395 RepID=A0A1A9UWH9_GLOAU